MTAVNLTNAEQVANILYAASETIHNPGTQPWCLARTAADEIRAAIARDQARDDEVAALRATLDGRAMEGAA